MNSIEIESAEYYLTAAEQGDVSAQFNLSVMYANGHGGLVQDFIFAHVWATRAAHNGDKEASLLCDLLTENMTKQQLDLAKKITQQCRSYRV
jgi:TPR repeat protein